MHLISLPSRFSGFLTLWFLAIILLSVPSRKKFSTVNTWNLLHRLSPLQFLQLKINCKLKELYATLISFANYMMKIKGQDINPMEIMLIGKSRLDKIKKTIWSFYQSSFYN